MLPFAKGFCGGRLLGCPPKTLQIPVSPVAPGSSPPHPQVFTLPKVSAKTKFKLTAHEGCRVRKVALVSLASTGSEERLENCLACLTNLGDIHIFTVPGLRPQVHYGCIRKEDISGIASCVFTKHGQGGSTRRRLGVLSPCRWDVVSGCSPMGGSLTLFVVCVPPAIPGFYLISPSEFERFSLSARNVTEPLCRLEIARLQETSCLRWDMPQGQHPSTPAPRHRQ